MIMDFDKHVQTMNEAYVRDKMITKVLEVQGTELVELAKKMEIFK